MRLWALIGIIALLILPFSIIQISIGENISSTTSIGLLWYSSEGEFFGFQDSRTESIQSSWFEDNGIYESYFGGFWYMGPVILILLVVGAVIAITATEKNNKNVPVAILLICGIMLTVLRFMQSDDGFYNEQDLLITTRTYIEIPISLLISIIFGVFDSRSD